MKLEDLCNVKYFGSALEIHPDESQFAYLVDDWGKSDCYIAWIDQKHPARLLGSSQKGTSGIKWHPLDGSLALVIDGNLWLAEPSEDWFELQQITHTQGVYPNLAWKPDGSLLLFIDAGQIQQYNVQTKQVSAFVIENFHGMAHPTAFQWNKDGSLFLYGFQDEPQYVIESKFGICTSEGQLLYSYPTTHQFKQIQWVSTNLVHFCISSHFSSLDQHYLLNLELLNENIVPKLILEESTPHAGAMSYAIPNPQGTHLLFKLEQDGWNHNYLYDLSTHNLVQLTFGECEDTMGFCWLQDGKHFIYSSNKGKDGPSTENHLYLFDLNTHQERKITGNMKGICTSPTYLAKSHRILFGNYTGTRIIDGWVLDLATLDSHQVTFSMPPDLEANFAHPEHVQFVSAHDLKIDAYLFKPPDFDPTRKYPGLVYCHGGPTCEIKGWDNSFDDGTFWSFQLYLATQGFVCLTVNERGGTGRGVDFRGANYLQPGTDDVLDMVNGGKYLQSLPFIDSKKVAAYGISYGAFLTLHALGQYPDVFCLGIPWASVWNWETLFRGVMEKFHLRDAGFFLNFGGNWEEHLDVVRKGSPKYFKDQIRVPILTFHGKLDPNASFEGFQEMIADFEALGLDYEAHTYADEAHVFKQRSTWLDAFSKMEKTLKKYLK